MSQAPARHLSPTELDRLENKATAWEETGASEYPLRIWQLRSLIMMARNSSSGFPSPRPKPGRRTKTIYPSLTALITHQSYVNRDAQTSVDSLVRRGDISRQQGEDFMDHTHGVMASLEELEQIDILVKTAEQKSANQKETP